MKLYHSTNVSFDKIDIFKSKPNKDFGRAFYVSANPQEIEPVGKAKVLLEGGVLSRGTDSKIQIIADSVDAVYGRT